MVLRISPPPLHPMRSTDFWPRPAPPAATPPWSSTCPASSTAATRIGCRRALPPRRCRRPAPSAKPLIYISQHGFRTFFAGPQSLWNPDISANDWLMQVRAARSFHRSRQCQPRVPQASSLNCYEYSARNLECDHPYAPAADESFRAQWLHYRQLKQVNSARYVLCPPSAHSRSSWPLRTNC